MEMVVNCEFVRHPLKKLDSVIEINEIFHHVVYGENCAKPNKEQHEQ